jgi:hypothetical protein
MKPIPFMLIASRLLATVSAIMIVLALTWPWTTLRLSSTDLGPDLGPEMHFSFSGSDLSTMGAVYAALSPKLADLAGRVSKAEPSLTSDRTFRQVRDQLEAGQQNAQFIAIWLVAMWALPIIAATLALVLLVTNGVLRFRRGFGAALAIMALLTLVALVITKWRIDGLLPQLRANPGLSDAFDALDRANVTLSLQTEQAVTLALLFAALLLLGGIVELLLPFPSLLRSHRMLPLHSAPALQGAGASLEMPVSMPATAPAVLIAPRIETSGPRAACVACGRSLPVGAKFCGGCGSRQE